jgi:hypothetical protein
MPAQQAQGPELKPHYHKKKKKKKRKEKYIEVGEGDLEGREPGIGRTE